MGRVDFDVTRSLIVVDATVYGPNPARLLTLPLAVDTGASCTIIPSDVATALGYDPATSSERRRIVTGSGVEYAPLIRLTKLSAIGETIEDLEALCHDLPDEACVDGLLGTNFLRNFDIHISFSQGVIELRRRA